MHCWCWCCYCCCWGSHLNDFDCSLHSTLAVLFSMALTAITTSKTAISTKTSLIKSIHSILSIQCASQQSQQRQISTFNRMVFWLELQTVFNVSNNSVAYFNNLSTCWHCKATNLNSSVRMAYRGMEKVAAYVSVVCKSWTKTNKVSNFCDNETEATAQDCKNLRGPSLELT